ILSDALAAGRAVCYPRVDAAAGTIVARRIRDRSELARGAHGILEPAESAEPLDSKKFAKILVCVPGVALGLEGQRLGRGGGLYQVVIGPIRREAPLPARGTRTKEVNPGGSNHGNPGIHSWWRGLFHLGNNETA